jgi:hypothetical protein
LAGECPSAPEETVKLSLALLLSLSIFLAPVTATAAEGLGSGLVLEAGFGCKMQEGKLVCGKKSGGESKKNSEGSKKNTVKDDDDDDDDDKPKEKKKAFSCKKAKCDPGETKLDKPNIYGACCQVGAAPLTPKTTPVEPEKCKFPGELGTPPNCYCPDGTEFMGYKGCVVPQTQPVPSAPEGKYCSEDLSEAAHKEFKAGCKGFPYCTSPNNQPPFIWECCCTPRK